MMQEELKLFHVSETPGIKIFHPKPSPSSYEKISDNVVFAVSEKLLHNYLLPRDCPRVTFYANPLSSKSDKEKYFGDSAAEFVIAVEEKWIQVIHQTILYIYEFPADQFTLLDEVAGYYISYESIVPVSIKPVTNILTELSGRNIELRIMPSVIALADEVSKSSLSFSIIRMRNASQINI